MLMHSASVCLPALPFLASRYMQKANKPAMANETKWDLPQQTPSHVSVTF